MTTPPDSIPEAVPHGLGDLTDATAWSEARLTSAMLATRAELERRYAVTTIPAKVDQLVGQYQAATGRKDGDTWAQPVSSLGAYRQGAVVTHGGKRWESLIPNNVRPPGEAADPQSYRWWKDLTPVPDPPVGQPPQWDPNGRAYKVGDLVTYQGKTYRVLQAHPSQPGWTPAAVPALWTVVT